MVMAHAPDADAKKRARSSKKQTVSRAAGVNDPRYAALIMNPVTGEIYHQQGADARRYPASLTKMMTLYLLFEALDKKKISLDDRMYVSSLAAHQPQTNLSLDSGDRIEVETAIKSLVVRSANDVSVVVAEALGGDVETFAEMMTAKARALGMRNTVFKNPNGLPNSEQRTTARDMAKLGIALKRDFPRYYKYFSTLQFSHNGVTYYTHNRVMLRYAGVDGIKTGYIGASGFNLVTSANRGGRPLIGVVLGGSSGRWRDDRMIALLNSTYQTISSRGAAPGKWFPGNLPLKQGAKAAGIDPTMDVATIPSTIDASGVPEAADTEDGGADELAQLEAIEARRAAPVRAPITTGTVPVLAPAPFVKAMKTKGKETTDPNAVDHNEIDHNIPFAMANPEQAPMPPNTEVIRVPGEVKRAPTTDVGWGIQVGAFSTRALADQAVQNALESAARQLIGARPAVVGPNSGGGAIYRARINNISQTQAKRACDALISLNSPCFIFKAAP